MSTISDEQKQAIRDKVNGMNLCSGLGTDESACSIAAINLALSGRLTDEIPDCMSYVIGKWIIKIQDNMSEEIRNSDRWKSLLPYAAGTGKVKEDARFAIIMDWMWTTVLPVVQPIADVHGFGETWKNMLDKKTASAAADTAADTATAADAAAYDAAASYAALAARRAAAAAAAATRRYAARAHAAGDAAYAAADAAAYAAYAAAYDAAYDADAADRCAAAWKKLDPCGLLEKLINA